MIQCIVRPTAEDGYQYFTPDGVYNQTDLIAKIRARNHPIDEQLVEIVKGMKHGDETKEPQAFYGDIPSVNGIPKKGR